MERFSRGNPDFDPLGVKLKILILLVTIRTDRTMKTLLQQSATVYLSPSTVIASTFGSPNSGGVSVLCHYVTGDYSDEGCIAMIKTRLRVPQ
jgi:hypothetical protein